MNQKLRTIRDRLSNKLKDKQDERFFNRIEKIVEPLVKRFDNVDKSVSKLAKTDFKGVIELQDQIRNREFPEVPDTTENINKVSDTISETSKQAQTVREIQTGKLTKVEQSTQKQVSQQQEANKIARKTQAEIIDLRSETIEGFAKNQGLVSDLLLNIKSVSKAIPKVSLKTIESLLASIEEVLTFAWNEKEQAVNVIVKNQVKQTTGGGGGIIPFETDEGQTKKALLDDEGRVKVNAIADPTEPTDFEGGKVTVGTSEVEVTFSGTTQSISLQSDVENTGYIYLGKTGVQNDGTNAVRKLEPGGIIDLDYNDTTNAIYAISDTAGQTLYKLALL